MYSASLQALIDAMRCLPGVGPKSAQRMAFYLLEHRKQAESLISGLRNSLDKVIHCKACRNYTDTPLCFLCQNPKRQANLLCVVETPADVMAIENSQSYRGHYFVLHGHLSPLDGIGPEDLHLERLTERFATTPPEEVIIATNPTAEGEATAYYISKLAKQYGLATTRIAHGIPVGGELEYIDGNTLALALNTRRAYRLDTPQSVE